MVSDVVRRSPIFRSHGVSGPAWLSLRGFVERERWSVARWNEAGREEECVVVDCVRVLEQKGRKVGVRV